MDEKLLVANDSLFDAVGSSDDPLVVYEDTPAPVPHPPPPGVDQLQRHLKYQTNKINILYIIL